MQAVGTFGPDLLETRAQAPGEDSGRRKLLRRNENPILILGVAHDEQLGEGLADALDLCAPG